MEATAAKIVLLINSTECIRDRCFTVLGSPMVKWASILERRVRGFIHGGGGGASGAAGAGAATETGDEEEDGFDAAALLALLGTEVPQLACRVSSTPAGELMRVMKAGGVVTFARTASQMNKLVTAIQKLQKEQLQAEPGAEPSSHIVILDEADVMIGTGAADNFQYEIALEKLTSNGSGRSAPVHEGGGVRTPLRIHVSATNLLCFYAAVHDDVKRGHGGLLMDVISMSIPAGQYMGLDQVEKFTSPAVPDGVLGPKAIQPAMDGVCEAVLDLYEDAIKMSENPEGAPACLLAAGVSRCVNNIVPHNMQDHIKAIKKGLSDRGVSPHFAAVALHGGDRTFEVRQCDQ